jgi:hypothetical protein
MASRIPTREELAKRPYIDRVSTTSSSLRAAHRWYTTQRDWTIYSRSQSDPLSVMMLQQMIADSYTDARDIWERNKNRPREKGDDASAHA